MLSMLGLSILRSRLRSLCRLSSKIKRIVRVLQMTKALDQRVSLGLKEGQGMIPPLSQLSLTQSLRLSLLELYLKLKLYKKNIREKE